jgi:tetratricopeptide (TPR) repeat protein
LAQLYRDRDGTLAKLVIDFEVRATKTGPDQYGATVALAGLYKLDGRAQEAGATYEKAIDLKKDDPNAILALARLLQDRGDVAGARQRFEQALELQTAQADREQTLRTLMGLALDAQDWNGASGYHRQLVKLEPTSLFVRGELGRELFSRGEYARAEGELKAVATAAAGDNRALAPALKELGRAQAKAHENQEALATLKAALAAAGDQAALRAEIYATIAEIYRVDQQLPVLIKQLEDEHPNDGARLALLGGLYEETGDGAKAIETYRRALAANPRQIDLHLRMIRLLQANGDLDRAITEYEALIHAAPNNPQFVFEECEALLQRGDHARALKLVTDLEARGNGDEEVLSRVADFYARIGESDKSLRVLQRLASGSGATDPGHLVDLGDRYFQDGNVPLAVQTWKRILLVVQPRARALAALGDVYLEHDMSNDAVAAYREAVQLDRSNLTTKKALAAAYERTRQYREARLLYEEIVAKAKENGDKTLARECRTRIVSLWGLERILEQQLPTLRKEFTAAPPDAEAGRMLAEALLHLRRLPEAEATLRRVIDVAPATPRATWRSSACWCRRTRSGTPSWSSSTWRSSSRSARVRSTSEWRSTRSRRTTTKTPSSTRRAPSSSTPTTPRGTGDSARCTGPSKTRRAPSPSSAPPSSRTTASSSCTSSWRISCSRRARPTRPTASSAPWSVPRPTRSSWRGRRASRCRSTSARGRSSRWSRTSCRSRSATPSAPSTGAFSWRSTAASPSASSSASTTGRRTRRSRPGARSSGSARAPSSRSSTPSPTPT